MTTFSINNIPEVPSSDIEKARPLLPETMEQLWRGAISAQVNLGGLSDLVKKVQIVPTVSQAKVLSVDDRSVRIRILVWLTVDTLACQDIQVYFETYPLRGKQPLGERITTAICKGVTEQIAALANQLKPFVQQYGSLEGAAKK